MDERLKPYSAWLEGFLQSLVAHKPAKIGVVCLLDNGQSLTGFFGDVCSGDKGTMAYHIIADAFLDEVFANAAAIVKEAEKQEDRDA